MVADVGPVLVTGPSLGLTATWYSAIPVLSVDASQATEIWEDVTPKTTIPNSAPRHERDITLAPRLDGLRRLSDRDYAA
jgi:hypothetical protein